MNAAAVYEGRFGARPAGVWSAPGRVNLIGEHTDYHGGLVLPFAIDARASVALGRSPTGVFRVTSAQRGRRVITASVTQLRPRTRHTRGWPAYPLGVVWALRDAGHDVPALDIALHSTVPAGAGLSSSAAVECATALAISDYLRLGLDLPSLARLAQRAENDFVGVPCGLMDQMASAVSRAGHALFFDVGADVTEHIPFDPVAEDLTVLVVDTRAHHSLADGEYARRRADGEAAALALGVPTLSHLGTADLDAALGSLTGPRAEVLRRRVRHVVTENERVRTAVDLLRAGRIADLGPLLSASHASLRDDYEVSCAELDLAAQVAERAGALGARMVGGGFGGSIIALVPAGRTAAVADAVIHAFDAAGWDTPRPRSVLPADGARRDR